MKVSLRTIVIALAAVLAAGLAAVPATAQKAQESKAADRAAKLLAKADTIAKKVAKLRGLRQKRPIRRGVMQKHEIRKRLLERIDDEYSADELAAEELAMKRLGLLDPSADYKKLVVELLTDQIAGFYDPVERQLYIAGWQSGLAMFDDILMAHEIDHALQDQHFGLRRFMKHDRNNSDATVARQALVEGDGTALMFEYMMSNMGVAMPWADQKTIDTMSAQMSTAMAGAGLGNIPLVLREGMIFPYMGGLKFVAHFRRHHRWQRVNAIYNKPPLSTEHILHPDKYEVYERPDVIRPAALAALPGYRRAYSNVNGELGLSILLRQHAGRAVKGSEASRKKAARATAGWGGDRMVVYTPPGHDGGVRGAVGVSYSVWDETADAIEFFEMLSDAMASLSGGKAVKDGDEYIEYVDSEGARYLAQRKGGAVVVVLGAPGKRGEAVLGQVWKAWKVKRRR